MTTDSWINETLYPDWGQRFRIKRELARVQSDFQDIVIFESHSHGRVMVLDGVIQITEADEFVYQEMLAHVPLLAHGADPRVADRTGKTPIVYAAARACACRRCFPAVARNAACAPARWPPRCWSHLARPAASPGWRWRPTPPASRPTPYRV